MRVAHGRMQRGTGAVGRRRIGVGARTPYVGLGYAPTLGRYDMAPYLDGSNEEVTLGYDAPVAIHTMVRGYSNAPSGPARFTLKITREP